MSENAVTLERKHLREIRKLKILRDYSVKSADMLNFY